MSRHSRTPFALVRQRLKLTIADFHDCEFGGNEEPVQQNEQQHDSQLNDDNPRRFPVCGWSGFGAQDAKRRRDHRFVFAEQIESKLIT
jgi:hypothetical protein